MKQSERMAEVAPLSYAVNDFLDVFSFDQPIDLIDKCKLILTIA